MKEEKEKDKMINMVKVKKKNLQLELLKMNTLYSRRYSLRKK